MTQKANILFVTDSAGVSGAELVILNIMKYLDRNRFCPCLFCDKKNEPLIEKAKLLGVPYKTSKSFPPQSDDTTTQARKAIRYSKTSIRIGFELLQHIRSEHIDIIYANAYPNCLFCLIPSLVSRKPLIWHVHNIRPIRARNILLYRLLGRVCYKIITVSHACKTHLMTAGIPPTRFVTIYNGIDLNRFLLTSTGEKVRKGLDLDPDVKIAGLFGQPIPEKGHRYFIEAAAQVVKKNPRSVFFIVGYVFRSEYQRYLEMLVDKLGLKKNVLFLGWREDIPEVMASVDVMAHTRVTPEPAALVLMEAMAMGKPIVASNTGGTRELVLDNVTGILVPPADAEGLAAGILQLFNNPEKAQSMGINGRKRIERMFTLEKQMNLVERLLLEILKRKFSYLEHV